MGGGGIKRRNKGKKREGGKRGVDTDWPVPTTSGYLREKKNESNIQQLLLQGDEREKKKMGSHAGQVNSNCISSSQMFRTAVRGKKWCCHEVIL